MGTGDEGVPPYGVPECSALYSGHSGTEWGENPFPCAMDPGQLNCNIRLKGARDF